MYNERKCPHCGRIFTTKPEQISNSNHTVCYYCHTVINISSMSICTADEFIDLSVEDRRLLTSLINKSKKTSGDKKISEYRDKSIDIAKKFYGDPSSVDVELVARKMIIILQSNYHLMEEVENEAFVETIGVLFGLVELLKEVAGLKKEIINSKQKHQSVDPMNLLDSTGLKFLNDMFGAIISGAENDPNVSKEDLEMFKTMTRLLNEKTPS